MKKLIVFALVLGLIGATTTASAQEDTPTVGQKVKRTTKKVAHKTANTAKKVGNETEVGAKKVGNKTAEVASKSKAKITDETYKDKTGPNGETVYIDNHSKYYYVDKKGHRHYSTDAELKAKQ